MNDVFGKALYDYWHGDQTSAFLVRREDGHTDEGSVEGYFDTQLYTSEEAITSHIKGKILDVGCGAGRHVLHFQDAGFEVVGIDNSPMAVKVCQDRGCKNVYAMDIFNPNLEGELFDSVLLFGNNIGIGGTLDGVKALLQSIKQVTKPGGILLMTSMDVTKTTNKNHLEYQKRKRDSKCYVGSLKIRMEYKGVVGDWMEWLHIEPIVLEQLARETGWTITKLVESVGGEYSAVLQSNKV